jgi:ubiquinone/menaquinone biosynthesis C-methylase UbiE
VSYADITASLKTAYARSAGARDEMIKHDWKLDERAAFLSRLSPGSRLLEVGAGTGQDAVFFRDNGIEDVVVTDLTPEMVERCIEKGLDAHVRDVMDLGFPDASFDAVWTINCLLHVPTADLGAALIEIARVLRPDGLLYLGVYSTDPSSEGINDDDNHDPKRFFAFRPDDVMQRFVEERFEVVDFHTFEIGAQTRSRTFRFQSFTARKR